MVTRGRGSRRGMSSGASGSSSRPRIEEHVDRAEDHVGGAEEHMQSSSGASGSQSRRGGRGPTKLLETANLPPRMRPIHCMEGDIATLNRQAVGQVTVVIRTNFSDSWLSWSEVQEDIKDNMFKSWMKLWRPVPEDDIPRVRQAFERIAPECFRGFTDRLRTTAQRMAGVDRFDASCVQYCPDCLTAPVWQRLCERWLSEQWQVRSIAGRMNRQKQVTIHGGGSITFGEHLNRMHKENADATPIDVYRKVYMREDGSYRGEEPKQYLDAYHAAASNTTQEAEEGTDDTLPAPFNPVAWIEATGGTSKGRVKGLGKRVKPADILGTSSMPSTASSRCSYASHSSRTVEQDPDMLERFRKVEEDLAARDAELAAVRAAQQQRDAERDAELAALRASQQQTNELLQTLILQQRFGGIPPPPPSDGAPPYD